MKPREWYAFQTQAADPTVVELSIFGSIGTSWWDDNAVSAKQFLEDLKALAPEVTKIVVRVNSLGGDVFDGVAIANSLRDQAQNKGRTVETVVDGIAASAASVVIMAGSVIKVADTAIVMVHNPWTIEIGNALQMRKTADALDKIRDASIVPAYQWHSKLSVEDIIALLDAETYMDADEAIANGFATEKVSGLKAAASIDARAASKLVVPEKYRDRVASLIARGPEQTPAPKAATADEVLAESPSVEVARELLAQGATLDQVKARVAADKKASAEAAARADQIRTLCKNAKVEDLAAGYIAGAMTVEAVRSHLTFLTARLDQPNIDGSLPVDPARATRAAALNAADIYAARKSVTAK